MDDFVTIETFSNEFEAEMVQVRLRNAGIVAFVAKDDCGSMEPHLQLTRGVELKVKKSDFPSAMELIGLTNQENPFGQEEFDENDDEERAFRESIERRRKIGVFGGRIICFIVACFFGGIGLLPIREDSQNFKYLFFLLFIFVFIPLFFNRFEKLL